MAIAAPLLRRQRQRRRQRVSFPPLPQTRYELFRGFQSVPPAPRTGVLTHPTTEKDESDDDMGFGLFD